MVGSSNPRRKLREDVRAYHFVNCDFQLLRRLGIESEVWKSQSEAGEPDRLECHWKSSSGDEGCPKTGMLTGGFQETEPLRGHEFDAPIFALRGEDRKPCSRHFYSFV